MPVVIGANGAGKTSLLDALSLLSASANRRLKCRTFPAGRRGGKASSSGWAVDMDIPRQRAIDGRNVDKAALLVERIDAHGRIDRYASARFDSSPRRTGIR